MGHPRRVRNTTGLVWYRPLPEGTEERRKRRSVVTGKKGVEGITQDYIRKREREPRRREGDRDTGGGVGRDDRTTRTKDYRDDIDGPGREDRTCLNVPSYL